MELNTIYYDVTLEDDGTGLRRTSIVSAPAIEMDFKLFHNVKQTKTTKLFSKSDEKRYITGPIMIPNKPMLRAFSDGSGYYNCVFTEESILNTVKKASKFGKFNELNLRHSQLQKDMVHNVYLIESLILGENTSSNIEEYKDLPNGTWIGTFWVEDENYWNDVIKSDEFNGFSVEIAVNTTEEDFLKQKMKKHTEKIISDVNMSKENKLDILSRLWFPEEY